MGDHERVGPTVLHTQLPKNGGKVAMDLDWEVPKSLEIPMSGCGAGPTPKMALAPLPPPSRAACGGRPKAHAGPRTCLKTLQTVAADARSLQFQHVFSRIGASRSKCTLYRVLASCSAICSAPAIFDDLLSFAFRFCQAEKAPRTRMTNPRMIAVPKKNVTAVSAEVYAR